MDCYNRENICARIYLKFSYFKVGDLIKKLLFLQLFLGNQMTLIICSFVSSIRIESSQNVVFIVALH